MRHANILDVEMAADRFWRHPFRKTVEEKNQNKIQIPTRKIILFFSYH
jgi:hypothetical protein